MRLIPNARHLHSACAPGSWARKCRNSRWDRRLRCGNAVASRISSGARIGSTDVARLDRPVPARSPEEHRLTPAGRMYRGQPASPQYQPNRITLPAKRPPRGQGPSSTCPGIRCHRKPAPSSARSWFSIQKRPPNRFSGPLANASGCFRQCPVCRSLHIGAIRLTFRSTVIYALIYLRSVDSSTVTTVAQAVLMDSAFRQEKLAQAVRV